MNNLTDRQKAQLYNEAIVELKERIKWAQEMTKDTRLSDSVRDSMVWQLSAYGVALELLTENELTEYLYEPTGWEKAADVGKSAIFGIGCAFAAFMLFQMLKFTLETFGLI